MLALKITEAGMPLHTISTGVDKAAIQVQSAQTMMDLLPTETSGHVQCSLSPLTITQSQQSHNQRACANLICNFDKLISNDNSIETMGSYSHSLGPLSLETITGHPILSH